MELMELLGKLLVTVGLGVVTFGSIYAALFYLPERFSRAKKILRKIELLDQRSQSDGYITVFDLATKAEVSPKVAKSALDKYVRELEGEKLVSSKGQVYYIFPSGEKIFQQKTQLQLESATERRINELQSQVDGLKEQIERIESD
ncbi:MAG: hypothetical protein AAFQ14_02470 [Cyanobacteria bacterium J06621_12]